MALAAARTEDDPEDEICDDAAAVPEASLPPAGARLTRVGAGTVDEDETLSETELAPLARALRE